MCRRILAICLIILFIPLVILTVFYWSAKITCLNKNYYFRQLEKNNYYEAITESGARFLIMGLAKSEGGTKLSDEEAKKVIQSFISQDWFENNYKLVISHFFDFLNNNSKQFEAKIDLESVKSGLNQSLPILLEAQIASLPICEQEKIFDEEKFNCRPQGKSAKSLVAERLKSQDTQSLIKDLPDTFDLGAVLAKNQKQLEQWRKNSNIISLSFYILTAFCFVILVAIYFLIYQPLNSVLRYLAITLLIPGVLLLFSVLGIFSTPLIINCLNFNLNYNIDLVNNLLFSFVRGYFWIVFYFAISFIIVSVVLLILAKIYKPKTFKIVVK